MFGREYGSNGGGCYGGLMNGNTKIAHLTPHHAMLGVAPDPDTGGVTVRVYGTLRKGRQTWQAHALVKMPELEGMLVSLRDLTHVNFLSYLV